MLYGSILHAHCKFDDRICFYNVMFLLISSMITIYFNVEYLIIIYSWKDMFQQEYAGKESNLS